MLICDMKIFITLLSALLLSSTMAQSGKSELEVLTDNYNKARERVVKPVDDKYKEELKRLLEKYSKQGNIKEVEKVAEKIKYFTSSQESSISGTEWITEAGTTFVFKENGKGYRKFGTESTQLEWKYIENDTFLITTTKNAQGPTILIYMTLTTKYGSYGDFIDRMTSRITQIR
jgi:hypothetical protein